MGEGASFTETIKAALEKASAGLNIPEEIFFVGQDELKKGRFLSDWEGRTAVVMHNRFQYMMPQPCLKQFGEACPFHDEGVLKPKETVTWYAWTLWSYEHNAKRIGFWKPSQNTPIGQMLDLFELKGTIRDRDALFTKTGKGPKTTTRVKMWLDPEPFGGADTQPFSEERILTIVKGLIKKRTVAELSQPLEFKKEG